MSFLEQLDQTNNQLNQDQTQLNQDLNQQNTPRDNTNQPNVDQINQNEDRILTRAEAAAKGIQPSSRLLTPKRGTNGRITGRKSNGSRRRPVGIKKAKGIRKEHKKKNENKQNEDKEDQLEDHQSGDQETEEWGGIGDVGMEIVEEEGIKEGNDGGQFVQSEFNVAVHIDIRKT
ncbi:uncharacterized protein MELLADRAFT_106552 [Melampsora larici-populina 98AG31]|uniref:Uncharacterized protein n=1 Tax=Melampsora larici-populina (strain 98AG31 / pathotype 3-4-7) TaxID=747676 RepID=F4RLV7_MELLP|nr:uncharacterized protein MELLADRAFT_106552 [Melampsora larici-populina 98AG31]EGG06609.1 hypothetical protein MELLADRAFT_106552 [Melampsora larici-populina 98AG31]